MSNLDAIMKPKSVAIIGASAKEGSIGNEVMKKIKAYKFNGNIYPINPKGGEIEGIKAYTNINEVKDEVEMAVIVTPSKFVSQNIDECAQKGVKGLVVISAGFKEVGHDGIEMEAEILEKVKKYGMRMIGPNCVGVMNCKEDISLDASFVAAMPSKGDVGFISQSGALGCGITGILRDLNIGFAQFVSAGNQADVNAEDMLEYWENQDDVKQIMLYMESIVDPQNFRKFASRITKKKPIVAIKSGRSAAGASAASSHTGSLAGADIAADALLKQSGVIRTISLKEMFETAQAFSNCPLPKGKKVAIVTNAGGLGILATDALEDNNLEMAKIEQATKDKMMSYLPPQASVKNPVDMIASATMEHYQKTTELCIQDPNVDMVMVIYLEIMGAVPIEMAKAIMEIQAKHPEKPVVGVCMTTSDFTQKLADLDKVTMPWYSYPEEASKALAKLYNQAQWQMKPAGKEVKFDVDKNKVEEIVKFAISENREQLTTLESIDVLQAYGIRACKYGMGVDVESCVKIANEIGYPVVAKITSKTISHKTDVGGVIVGIQSEAQLRSEYADLIERLKKANILDGLEGIIIQEMVKGSREMVCGLATDPQYGPMLMFGLGGVFIEVMKDVCFRIAPLTDNDADDMMKSIKSYELLLGARGTKPAQMEQIKETLLRLSQLVGDFKFIDELDINPLLISEKTGEGIAVDGRIKFRMQEAKDAMAHNQLGLM